jgi:hypothetical protein
VASHKDRTHAATNLNQGTRGAERRAALKAWKAYNAAKFPVEDKDG